MHRHIWSVFVIDSFFVSLFNLLVSHTSYSVRCNEVEFSESKVLLHFIRVNT